jgi:hypothetical protein
MKVVCHIKLGNFGRILVCGVALKVATCEGEVVDLDPAGRVARDYAIKML